MKKLLSIVLLVAITVVGINVSVAPEQAAALGREAKINCYKTWNNRVFTAPKYSGEAKFKDSNCYTVKGGNCSIISFKNQIDDNGNPVINHKVQCTDPRQAASQNQIPSVGDPALDYANSPCSSPENCNIVKRYVNPFINFFLAPLAILAVIIGIIYGGIEYITSSGDPQKAAHAKDRIRKALIGLVAFIVLYALISWLLPGGL